MSKFLQLFFTLVITCSGVKSLSNDHILQRFAFMEQDIAKLKTEVNLLNAANARLNEDNQRLHSLLIKLQQYEPTYDGLHRNIDKHTKNSGPKMETKRLLLSSESPPTTDHVAFCATLTNTISNLGTHQAIEYDKVITNVGHGYDARHGHFTSPKKGIYLLSVTAHAINDAKQKVALDLVVNGNIIFQLLSDGSGGNESNMSQVFPIVLETGDMVWMRTKAGYEGKYLYGSTTWTLNSFSGVLLSAL
ncbi:complement C1q tumor necrosis factor-related protein 3-like [Mytilus trossulus]|uniref:complement C1q tumor necrosis factor-related protein 3-like n=1 Tax=Mytilus trossulus TaxID=6551 RepID=UPI0030048023